MDISADDLKRAWQDISKKVSEASGQSYLQKQLTAGPVVLSAVIRVSDDMPGLLLHVPEGTSIVKWNSLQVSGIKFEAAVKIKETFGLPIMMTDAGSIGVFAIFTSDLATAASEATSAKDAAKVIFDRVALWRRFLQKRTAGLSDEEIHGLLGELSVLRDLIVREGIDSALASWKGPTGELHDFRLPNCRVEVKTWSNISLPRIFISDPAQIVIDELDPIWLAVVELSRDSITGRSLPEIIGAFAGGMDSTQKEDFSSSLADYGYLNAHAELYREKFTPREPVYYKITEGFPMIPQVVIPPGISSVKYAIDISAISEFIKPLGV